MTESTPVRSNASGLMEAVRFLKLAFWPGQGRVDQLYRALADTNGLGRRTLYQNLGYWKDGAADLDEAGDALAELVANAGKVTVADRVLDSGFGFGDQDVYWMRRFSPREICAVNITPEQVPTARKRIEEAGYGGRVRVSVADAVRLPFAAQRFDVVLSLESAFHYRSRTDFFREAFRVLRPGGRLAMADIAGTGARSSLADRAVETIGRSFWQIPLENLCTVERYREQLAEAGFGGIEIESIGEHVYPPFIAHARSRLLDADVTDRMNPLLRCLFAASVRARKTLRQLPLDYLLVAACKPASGASTGSAV